MKPIAIFLLAALLLTALAGCRSKIPQDTNGSTVSTEDPAPGTEVTVPSQSPEPTVDTGSGDAGTADTASAKILQKIWDSYPQEERFSAYGGRVEMAVTDGPGDLEVSNTEELTTRYLVPEAQTKAVSEGASLSHLMNSNIFTAAVFRLADSSQLKTFADAWHTAIRDNHWICGQPDRLLLVQVDKEHILMAFASQELMPAFEQRLTEAYPDSQILHKEAIAV